MFHEKKYFRELLQSIRGHLSQEVVRKRLGSNYNVLYQWESGRVEPSWDQFVEYCKACKKDVGRALRESFHIDIEEHESHRLLIYILETYPSTQAIQQLGLSKYSISRLRRNQQVVRCDTLFGLMFYSGAPVFEFIEKLIGVERSQLLIPYLKYQRLKMFLSTHEILPNLCMYISQQTVAKYTEANK